MKIHTIQDLNAIECCCPLPGCPENRYKHWSRSYDSWRWLIKPFIQPSGDATDDIPELYQDTDYKNYKGTKGTVVWYEGWNENPTAPGWAELRQRVDWDFTNTGYEPINGWPATAYIEKKGNTSVDGPTFADAEPWIDITMVSDPANVYETWFSYQFSISGDYAANTPADHTEEVEAESWEVTPTYASYFPAVTRRWSTEQPMDLQGSGGQEHQSSKSIDVTTHTMQYSELKTPFTKASTIQLGILVLETHAFQPLPSIGQPESVSEIYHNVEGGSTYKRWPTIQDANPWAGPPSYGISWNDYIPKPPIKIDWDLIGQKYQVGIPEDWETKNAAWLSWKQAHDLWEDANPQTRGDEPVEPKGKRSVFECQWQEVFFPQAWDEWQTAHNTWTGNKAAWQTAHDIWKDADPDTRGPEPTFTTPEPQKPSDPEDRPSLIQNRSWNYGGPGSPAFSGEFMMPPPPNPGKVRPVNMMIVCYHRTAAGVKPMLVGEYINLENP